MDDKRELLKLRQGLVTADESGLEVDKKPEITKLTGKAALSNFVYHHSLQIKIVLFFLVIAGIFAYFTLTSEKYDITILLIADNAETSVFFAVKSSGLKQIIEDATPDYDGNGKSRVEFRFIDLVTHVGEIQRSPDAIHGNRVKLFGEVQTGDSLIYIGNKEALENIPGTAMSVEDFYYAFYSLGELITESQLEFPPDLYIAVRNRSDEAELAKALAVLEAVFLERVRTPENLGTFKTED
ncbi:MAG: hypothetical protein FWH07_07875 [Oscillospiraceae bacterium]|nr:hypothetical protein [Oscillospiraceae bacterium]